MHCVVPGVHEPLHIPPEHSMKGHVDAVPQVPLALQVATPVPEHSVAPGTHDPVHPVPPVAHAWVRLVQFVVVAHVPSEPHVWTLLFEHCVVPGTQEPVHAPATHALPALEQSVVVANVPVELQVWTLLPRHCVEPGVQTPVHAPPPHTYWQGTVAPQLPVASHVWRPVVLAHCVAPGVQTPVHTPLAQRYWHEIPLPHVPLALQVRATLPEHSVEVGAQDPVHTPATHAWSVQATGLPHVPFAPHVCTTLPEHCVVPGVHTPTQAPETQALFEQTVPQAPQLDVSVDVLEHVPPHSVGDDAGQPDAHAYVLPEAAHTGVPPLHTVPQAPQLDEVSSWTQAPLQRVYPDSQRSPQDPATHVGWELATVAVHAVPQVLQLSTSVVVSTQLVPQSVGTTDGQPDTQEYVPPDPAQTGVAPLQALPHAPQLALSIRLTHPSPHSV